MHPDPNTTTPPLAPGEQPGRSFVGPASALVLAVAGLFIGTLEGLNTTAKPDPINIPTRCFGDTGPAVRNGERHTRAECAQMLIERLQQVDRAVANCVPAPQTPEQRVAFVSLAYNIGNGAFCSSTLVAKFNRRDPTACAEIDRWVYARGQRLPGLVKRRAEERALCEGKVRLDELDYVNR